MDQYITNQLIMIPMNNRPMNHFQLLILAYGDCSMNTFNNSHHAQLLLNSYGQWFHEHMAYGWNGYLFTFMFGQIQGSDENRMLEMKKQLGWFYGRMAKAS